MVCFGRPTTPSPSSSWTANKCSIEFVIDRRVFHCHTPYIVEWTLGQLERVSRAGFDYEVLQASDEGFLTDDGEFEEACSIIKLLRQLTGFKEGAYRVIAWDGHLDLLLSVAPYEAIGYEY